MSRDTKKEVTDFLNSLDLEPKEKPEFKRFVPKQRTPSRNSTDESNAPIKAFKPSPMAGTSAPIDGQIQLPATSTFGQFRPPTRFKTPTNGPVQHSTSNDQIASAEISVPFSTKPRDVGVDSTFQSRNPTVPPPIIGSSIDNTAVKPFKAATKTNGNIDPPPTIFPSSSSTEGHTHGINPPPTSYNSSQINPPPSGVVQKPGINPPPIVKPVMGASPSIPPPTSGISQKPTQPIHPKKHTGFVPQFDSSVQSQVFANSAPIAQPSLIKPAPKQEEGWSWSSILDTASKSIESARELAGAAASTIGTNEKLRGLYQNVTPELHKLASLANESVEIVSNVVAPPLVTTSASKLENVTVWCCLSVPGVDRRIEGEVRRSLRENLTTAIFPFSNPQAYASMVTLNMVDDSVPVIMESLNAGAQKGESILEKLQSLADANPVAGSVPMLLSIQAYETKWDSMISESVAQIAFFGELVVCDNNGWIVSATSQSIESVSGQRYKDSIARVIAGLVHELSERILLKTYGDY